MSTMSFDPTTAFFAVVGTTKRAFPDGRATLLADDDVRDDDERIVVGLDMPARPFASLVDGMEHFVKLLEREALAVTKMSRVANDDPHDPHIFIMVEVRSGQAEHPRQSGAEQRSTERSKRSIS